MSKTDDLIERLYPEEQDPPLDTLWDKFNTSPKMPIFKSEGIRRSFCDGNCNHLLNRFRRRFFPGASDGAIEGEIFSAMNHATTAINSLCEDYLEDIGFDFREDRIPENITLFDFLMRGREQWIGLKDRNLSDGKKIPLAISAYRKARAYDLGKRVLHINADLGVLASVRHYDTCLNWFQELLGFHDKKNAGVNGHCFSWNTNPGIRIYGNGATLRSRVKIMYPDETLKYSSLLMKLCLEKENKYLEDIDDLTGFEFIVEDDKTRQEFIRYLKLESSPSSTLKDYKDRTRIKVDNPQSSSDFRNISFTLFVPVPLDHIGLGISRAYGSLPVEVQLFTLEEDRVRIEHPEVSHENYKKKSFGKVFPAWFPRQIYELWIG